MGAPEGPEVRDLGRFTSAELWSGGIGRRGFLQPLMAPRPGAAAPAAAEVVAGLARRGLMLPAAAGWRPVGRLLEVLGAAAAARSMVSCPPADAGHAAVLSPDVMGPDRILMGRLGATDLILDLLPGGEGYDVRLVRAGDLVEELLGWCALGAGAGDVYGGGEPDGDSRPPLREDSPEWAQAEADGLFSGPVVLSVEAASVTAPDRPMLQQRLTIYDATADGNRRWIGLGVAEGVPQARWAAPDGPRRARRILRQALLGERIHL